LVSEHVGEKVSLDTDVEHLATLLAERGAAVPEPGGSGKLLFELYELAHRDIWDPTFVVEFPTEVSPLSRRRDDEPRLTERFELVIAGAEYCNAFSELNDADDQLARFEAQAAARTAGDEAAHVIDHDYVEALEYGLPPTGGLGIGVDRLVMLLTDQAHIREVILFRIEMHDRTAELVVRTHVPQQGAPPRRNPELLNSGIVRRDRTIGRRAQVEAELFRRSFIGVVVEDVEGGAGVRRKLVSLAPADEASNAVAESKDIAAMFELRHARRWKLDQPHDRLL
jgi:hypothetical protein